VRLEPNPNGGHWTVVRGREAILILLSELDVAGLNSLLQAVLQICK
jgi:hypothetical protein